MQINRYEKNDVQSRQTTHIILLLNIITLHIALLLFFGETIKEL